MESIPRSIAKGASVSEVTGKYWTELINECCWLSTQAQLFTGGLSISQTFQIKCGLTARLSNLDPRPYRQRHRLQATALGLRVSGKSSFPLFLLFLPSVPCSPWSVTLASAHTEQTICLLLFSACQKQTHHFFISTTCSGISRLGLFSLRHVILRINVLKIYSLEVQWAALDEALVNDTKQRMLKRLLRTRLLTQIQMENHFHGC